MTEIPASDITIETPLYTYAEAARFLGVPTTTLATWAKGYVRHPVGRKPVVGAAIITSVAARPGFAAVPFVGLAEALVIAAFRRAGVSLQHIRAAVATLEREIGVEHALASRRLFTDGAVILFDYAEPRGDAELTGLTEVVSRQRVFAPVVAEYLRRIEYGKDGWPVRLVSPATERQVIVVDPSRSFGQPIFLHGAARIEDVVDRWRAGDTIVEVADDFGVPLADLEDVLRVTLPTAA